MSDDRWFQHLAELDPVPPERAPARLKSKTYSALLRRMAASGPLEDLARTRAAGGRLCVFEHLVAAVTPAELRSRNPCAVCHARVLAERMDRAPIVWPGCPYSEFHRD
jgi:hypothetical protein